MSGQEEALLVTIAQQQARIEALEEALRQVAAVPGPDLTNRAAANIARAALAALLSPAPADAEHEEGTP